MKTKTFLFAILVAFMCASCEEEVIEPRYNYEYIVAKIETSEPLAANYPKIYVFTFSESSKTECESNEKISLYSDFCRYMKNDTIFIKTVTCTKIRL